MTLLQRLKPQFGKLSLITYPADPEAWSESLTPIEGVWASYSTTGTIFLDLVNKASGNASIRHTTSVEDYYGGAMFTLASGKEFDATRKNSILHFLHALQKDTGFTGMCVCMLIDVNGVSAQKAFGTTADQTWQAKDLAVGPNTGWTEEVGFDWKHIRIILIDCFFANVGVGSFWVDRIYFSYEQVLATLRIESAPTGKQFEIDGTGGATPSTYQITPNIAYTVSIDSVDFVQWEDESTNPQRSITLTEGETKTIKAYYEGEIPPPEQPQLDWVLILGGGIGIGVVLLSLERLF